MAQQNEVNHSLHIQNEEKRQKRLLEGKA